MVHGSVSNVTGRECSVWRPVFLSEFHAPPPPRTPTPPPPYASLILSLSDGEASPRELPKSHP